MEARAVQVSATESYSWLRVRKPPLLYEPPTIWILPFSAAPAEAARAKGRGARAAQVLETGS